MQSPLFRRSYPRLCVLLVAFLAAGLRVSHAADTVPPTIKVVEAYTKPQGGNRVFVTIYVEAADDVGLAVPAGGFQFRGRLSGGTWDAWTTQPYDPEVPFTIGVDCTHFDLQFRSVDRAGNFSAPVTRSFTAPYANNPPPLSRNPKFVGPINLPAASTAAVVEILASFDFDGDNHNDLLNATADGAVSVRQNPGGDAVTFPPEVTFQTAGNLTGLAAGLISPLNSGPTNDEFPDVAVVADGAVHLFVNHWTEATHTLSFQEQGTGFSVPGVTLQQVAVGDIDGDGFDDIVASGDGVDALGNPEGKVAFFMNGGAATNGQIKPTATVVAAGATASAIALADVDDDGLLDVVVADTPNSRLTVLKNPAVGGSQVFTTTFRPQSLAVVDFTRDGILDVAAFGSSYESAQNHSTIGFSLLRGLGDGTFQTVPGDYHEFGVNGIDFSHPGNVVVSDFTDDDYPEIAVPIYYGAQTFVLRLTPILDNTNTLVRMRPDGYTILPETATADSTHPIRLAAGDLNGDHKPDLVIGRDASSSAINVYFNAFGGAALPITVPTGNFQFQFPGLNADLTSIFDITGNYTGVTPTKNLRPYNFDVAVDSGGKVDLMGTIDGIAQSVPQTARHPTSAAAAVGTTPLINMAVGSLSTRQGDPLLSVSGKFAGTRDGTNMTANGKFKGPVTLSDLGDGNQGVEGQGSFKANLGGVPSHASNVMVPLTVSGTQATNLKNAWGFKLSVSASRKGSKLVIMAGGNLKLPNGDLIEFAPRPVIYSKRSGYSIAFHNGQNTTLQPPAKDKKTSILLKKVTLARQPDNSWLPTGGRLTYEFLGQKGTADILDFLPPN